MKTLQYKLSELWLSGLGTGLGIQCSNIKLLRPLACLNNFDLITDLSALVPLLCLLVPLTGPEPIRTGRVR